MLSSGERISRKSSQLTSNIKTEQITVRRKIRSLTIVPSSRIWFETDVYSDRLSSNRRRTVSSIYMLSVQSHKSILNAATWNAVDDTGHDLTAPPKVMQTIRCLSPQLLHPPKNVSMMIHTSDPWTSNIKPFMYT